MSVNSVNCVNF